MKMVDEGLIAMSEVEVIRYVAPGGSALSSFEVKGQIETRPIRNEVWGQTPREPVAREPVAFVAFQDPEVLLRILTENRRSLRACRVSRCV